MTICLIGKNLTTLVLSKILINKGINVDLYYSNNNISMKRSNTISRTIGLSNDSIEFLESHNILLKKNCWSIKNINLYKGENPKSFLNFESKKNSFFMVSYNNFFRSLETAIKKKNIIKIKKNEKIFSLLKKNYEIIIISDTNNFLFKKYFSKRIKKDYNSMAFTAMIDHDYVKNNTAEQYFTGVGPLAFLPMSNNKTSIVFSVFDRDLIKDNAKIVKLIKHYNCLYNIKKISEYKNSR